MSDRVVSVSPVRMATHTTQQPDPTIVRSIASSIQNKMATLGTTFVSMRQAGHASPRTVEVPDAVQSALHDAETARRALDQNGAIQAYRQAIVAMENDLARLGNIEILVNAQVALASLYLASQDTALANAALQRALALRPTLTIDLTVYPPRVADALEAIKAQAPTAPAQLVVQTQPEGANVFIDGVSVGLTPLSRPLPQGRHVVWVGQAGFSSKTDLVDAVPGSFIRVEGQLAEHPSTALRRELEQALVEGDVGPESLDLAQSLAKAYDADAAFTVAIGRIQGGYAGVVSITHRPLAMVAFTLGSGLQELEPIAEQVAIALHEQRSTRKQMTTVPVICATGGPSKSMFKDVFSLRPTDGLVWMTPHRRVVRHGDHPEQGHRRPDMKSTLLDTSGASETEETGANVWPWLGVTGGIIVTAIATGTLLAIAGIFVGSQYRPLDITTSQQPHRAGDVVLNP